MATKEKKTDKPAKPAKGGGASNQAKQSKAAKGEKKGAEIKQGPHAGADLPIPSPRLKDYYNKTVRARLMEQFGLANVHEIPTVEKIVVNCGVGEAIKNPKVLDRVVEELAIITGQRPVRRKAKKSIANFGLREGQEIGASVTLRGERMWEFLDRFISIALPRVRDFRGVSPASFDGSGNYAIGLREQVIFPEISYDSIDTTRGLDVAIVTTTQSDEEARELLRLLGMPFRQS